MAQDATSEVSRSEIVEAIHHIPWSGGREELLRELHEEQGHSLESLLELTRTLEDERLLAEKLGYEPVTFSGEDEFAQELESMYEDHTASEIADRAFISEERVEALLVGLGITEEDVSEGEEIQNPDVVDEVQNAVSADGGNEDGEDFYEAPSRLDEFNGELTREDIVNMYWQDGRTQKECAEYVTEEYGVDISTGTFVHFMKFFDVPSRGAGVQPVPREPPVETRGGMPDGQQEYAAEYVSEMQEDSEESESGYQVLDRELDNDEEPTGLGSLFGDD